MSNRELAIKLLENVPSYKMGYVVSYLQGITADEEADDLYCEQLYQEYLNDLDHTTHETVTFEEAARLAGVNPDIK